MNQSTSLDKTRDGVSARTTRRVIVAAVAGAMWLGTGHAQPADAAGRATAQPMRLAAGGPIQLTIGATNVPAAPVESNAGRVPACASAASEPEQVILPVGKSRILSLPEPVRTRTLGNPAIVQAMLVSPTSLYLLGLDVGTTNMILQGRSGRCTIVDVVVGADPGGLQSTLRDLLPEAKNVRVSAAADSLVLSGSVADAVLAQKVMDIANAYVMRQTRSPLQAPQAGAAGATPMLAMNGGNMAGMGMGNQNGMPVRSPRLINMMSVEAPQQVMLEVKVAEVSKTLIDQMGSALNLQGAFGTWSFGLLANFLSGATDLLSFSKANNLPLKFALDAQKGDSLVKVLAEPTLMAISGQEASFLAGGKVFIPVPQSTGVGGSSTIVLQEETFGVGLRFTPTVLENGRINLRVAPEVSELSPTGVSVTAPGTNNTSILPLITTRRASTTLQVMDGQSFAIGGLIKNNITGSLNGLPGVGDLPVVGALARSTKFQQDKSEVLFVVTPRLVKPLPANYPMPTDTFGTPIPGEVYLDGNMEGHLHTPPTNAPAPVPAAQPAPAPATSAPVTSAPQAALAPANVAAGNTYSGAMVRSGNPAGIQ
ncbi:MAG: type II and III secretion system protein family protein [Cupriavidus sp.]|nr:type II and III secretion system protein family protein [Cupriavidus sp.]